MSIFDEGVSAVEGVVGTIVGAAKSAIDWLKRLVGHVWGWLHVVGGVLSGAWDWLVNGAEWFGSQVQGWAGEVFATIAHTLGDVIPKAIAWVAGQVIKWAGKLIHEVFGKLRQWAIDAFNFVVKLAHKLVRALASVVHSFIKWATDAVRWVLHWGSWIVKLLTHPANLVKWILSSLVGPLLVFLLKSSAPVFGWLFKYWLQHSREAAVTIEDMLHHVL